MYHSSPSTSYSAIASPAIHDWRSTASAPARFVPSNFAWNGRVAAALLPSLAVLAGHGGTHVAGVLIVGFMGAYILDGMRFKEGAFAAVWATLGITNMALVYSTLMLANDHGVVLALLTLLLGGLTLLLAGLWATLQFKWIQLQYPAVVMAFEKTLMVGCIPVAATVQAWGVASGAGMAAAPFFLAGALCVLYYLFALPLPSSFQTGPRRTSAGGAAAPKPAAIQGAGDGFLAFALAVCLPTAVYAATHSAVLLHWVHLWSLLLLTSGPLLFLTILPNGLWWAGGGRAVDALRRLLLLASLAGFLAAFEGRVVVFSFGQYIRLAAPWSYVAISIALYGTAAVALLHFSGIMGEEAAGALLGPVLMVSASVGSLAAGLPAWALPAPLLAAAGLALFYDSRAVRDYLLFVVGALLTGGWFLWHHFWFLDITLDGMHLRTLCGLICGAMAPAFLLPGLVYGGVRGRPVSLLLLLQAGLVCVLEEHLYAGDHAEVTYNVHPMFPAFLVAATSAAGLAAARRLAAERVVGEVASYALQCLYAAKLAMLVLPEARLTVPALGVALAVTPPLLLQQGGSGGGLSWESTSPQRRLAPWQGLGLAAATVLSVVAARFAVFDTLRFLLDRRPSEALVAGTLVVLAAAGCVPLVSRYYRGSAEVKRALMLACAAGLLLALLRPPLPLGGGAACPPGLPLGMCPRLWNEEHVPEHEEDDVAIYGDGLRRREHWPLWLLAGAAFSGLVAATSTAPVRQAAPLRLAQAAAAAALVGGYLALEFFPGMALLQAAITASSLAAAAAVVLLQVPTRGGAVLLPLLGLAWAACLPAALLLQATLPLPPLPADAHRLFPEFAEEDEVEVERRAAVKAAVLASFAAEALLLAFALKLRVAVAVAGSTTRLPATARGGYGADASYIDRAASFLGQCMPAYAAQGGGGRLELKGPGDAALKRLAADGMVWVPLCCNLVTALCFALCLLLNVEFTGGVDAAILPLAPLLLLLCQDPLLLRGLDDRRRYFPPAAAVFLFLLSSATLHLLDLGGDGPSFWLLNDPWYLGINAGGLLLCLPTQVDLLRYLWARHRVGAARAVAPAVIAAAGLAAPLQAVRLLAGVSAAAGVYLAASAQYTRQVGRKLI